MIGRDYDDPHARNLIQTFPVEVIDADNRILYKVTHNNMEKLLSPEEVSALILKDLKKSAEAFLDVKIQKAVIAVPAHFNNAQRQSTKDAANLAGLEVIKLVNEPTAAAVAHGLSGIGKKLVLVYDFGETSFDVSLLRMVNGSFRVIGIDGDPFLGGEDLDNRLVRCFVEEFEYKLENIHEQKWLIRQLRAHCKWVKHILSSNLEASFNLEGTSLKGSICRARFEEINNDLFERTIYLVKKVIKDAELSKADIDDVVLIGGCSRIPIVQTLLHDYFDGKKLHTNINPHECVALGACIIAETEKPVPSPKLKTVENKGGLTKEQKRKMIEEAKEFSNNNQQEDERIVILNQLEKHLYSSRRIARNSLGDKKINEEQYESVASEIKVHITWLIKNRNTASKEDLQKKLDETQHLS